MRVLYSYHKIAFSCISMAWCSRTLQTGCWAWAINAATFELCMIWQHRHRCTEMLFTESTCTWMYISEHWVFITEENKINVYLRYVILDIKIWYSIHSSCSFFNECLSNKISLEFIRIHKRNSKKYQYYQRNMYRRHLCSLQFFTVQT